MKLIRFEYATTSGIVYCVFFMRWLGSAYDYPKEALNHIGPWIDTTSPVRADIKGPSRCEATA